jgi:hypothetical protein
MLVKLGIVGFMEGSDGEVLNSSPASDPVFPTAETRVAEYLPEPDFQ